MDMRSEHRFPVHFRSTFSSSQASTGGEGTVVNLSRRGCRIKSDTNVQQESELVLRLYLPNHLSRVEIERAVVRWSAGDEFGVEIIGIQPEDQEQLLATLQELESGDPPPLG